ncbi:MAG: hypothetical protein ABIH69_00960 [bacterium]
MLTKVTTDERCTVGGQMEIKREILELIPDFDQLVRGRLCSLS